MGFVTLRLAASAIGRRYRSDGPGFRDTPETVVLEPRPGYEPSARPPVRIFLGTEPAQYRAERIFIWSIEQVRDPSRTYEITLMKDLAGFNRQLWLTGFTNYRFAIPHLAGGTGRAIYNDVDQVYLADPAEMFDLDMDGHGYLSISDADTSVMLMDCARMAEIWPLDAVKRERRKALEQRARAVPGLWGALDHSWNARDEEYVAGGTRCLHYTTLHTQPWHPFPQEYVYRESPVADVWHALERSADAARYLPFDALAPTAAYRALLDRLRREAGGSTQPEVFKRQELRLVYGFGQTGFDPARSVTPIPEPADSVVCPPGTLERLPDEDLLWTIDLLFRSARRSIGMQVRDRRPAEWWRDRVETIAAWYPGIAWEITVESAGRPRTFRGGRPLREQPAVWVLASEKTGHTSQAIGLVEALGWPYEVKDVRLGLTDQIRPDLGGILARLGLGGDSPAWPDVVVGSGWLAGRVARLIRERSGGRTRIVVMGRKGGRAEGAGEVSVALAHFGQLSRPRRILSALPPNQVTPERLESAARRWPDVLADRAPPRVVLLVGGTSRSHRLDAGSAGRLGRDVATWAAQTGGSLTVVTSRRTGPEATAALKVALGHDAALHEWRADEESPILGYLAHADVLVVTGESESMLAEAVTAGKPVYIYPLPEKAPNPWQRFSAWVATRAGTARINKRGTPRPQQGLEYLCARLLERGWILPPRNIGALHANLVELGVARMFGEPWQRWNRPAYDPNRLIADHVRALLDAPAAPPHGVQPQEARPHGTRARGAWPGEARPLQNAAAT